MGETRHIGRGRLHRKGPMLLLPYYAYRRNRFATRNPRRREPRWLLAKGA